MSEGDEKSGSHCASPPPQIPSGLQKICTSELHSELSQSAFELHVVPRICAETQRPERTGEIGEMNELLCALFGTAVDGLTASGETDGENARKRKSKIDHIEEMKYGKEIAYYVNPNSEGTAEVPPIYLLQLPIYHGLLSSLSVADRQNKTNERCNDGRRTRASFLPSIKQSKLPLSMPYSAPILRRHTQEENFLAECAGNVHL